jgi:hypothetical protein
MHLDAIVAAIQDVIARAGKFEPQLARHLGTDPPLLKILDAFRAKYCA